MKRTVEVDVIVTPAEVAEAFCCFFAEDQALFFNEVAKQVSKWKAPFCFQLQYITDCPLLSDDARYVMQQIGEYAQKESK